MTRNAMAQFDSFDPEVLEAARDVAARAGVPLETWIASVVPQQAAQGGRRSRRRPRPDPVEPRTAQQDDASQGADPVREAWREGRRETHDADRRQAGPPHDPASADAPILASVIDRLDELDRAMEEGRRASQAAEGRRLEEIEARIDRALSGGAGHEMAERIGEIERRMSQLGEQVAGGRPSGRRGRPAVAEMRDAVREIRQRRRELDETARTGASHDGGAVASMRADLARRLQGDPDAADGTAAAHGEMDRMRAIVGRLPSGREAEALEAAVRALAAGVDRAGAEADLGALAAPVERVRIRIGRLADESAAQADLAADVRRLVERSERTAVDDAGPDRRPSMILARDLDALRGAVASLASPDRLRALDDDLYAVSARIAQSRASGTAGPSPDEIPDLAADAGPAALAERIHDLAAMAETLNTRAAQRDDRTDAGDLSADLDAVRGMLRDLAENGDGGRDGTRALDALEGQVMHLASRIEAPRGADPALSKLERTMAELLRQMAALREAAPSEAAVARATREAVSLTLAQTLRGQAVPGSDGLGAGEIGLLRASLADMQARQAASDQRLGDTLDGVQSALERLVSRLGPAEAGAAAEPLSLEERLRTSTILDSARPGRGLREPGLDVAPAGEDLLEPGAARPPHEASAEVAGREPPVRRAGRPRPPSSDPGRPRADATAEGDIKTSFIAAARRAAQAAQAELAAEAAPERRESRASAAAPQGLLGRLRAEIDRRRRPLLLGLAAVVLALGALQVIATRTTEEPAREAPRAPQVVQARPAETAPAAPARVEAPKETVGEPARADGKSEGKPEDKAPPSDPQTTQSLPSQPAGDARPAPGKAIVPQAAGMNALSGDLANVPAGLAKLRQGALDGDGAAIWELAAREADGRGLPRDLAVAAKLYERLAAAGYAPAQYKLAGHYEKGSGLTRDLAQARLWYGRAAEQGHARAMHNLAVIYAENPAANGKPDFAAAASWFRQGAEYGIRDSQYNLAVLYARGLGLTQDLVQSYAWFSAAAHQGDEDAAKKRDDVATKLSPGDLAGAKGVAGAFKARKLDAAVNDPPPARDAITAPMSLLGVPVPSATAFTLPARRAI